MKKNNNSNFIPKILLYGVITSALFIIIGLIKIAFEKNLSIYYEFDKNNIFTLSGVGIINTGIFILILTPIIRVIGMLLNYILEKNRTYTIISSIVLLILFISLILGVKH
ncbi:DUF1634 domain-containing protein [Gemelliphila palaticanis]|uniref:DUF1634 domain-containing protein n=1 Tax=Gemelliphila palaticanis TaxID=81950 RepID=A0ABX2SYV7_9BACL|nr:DUF1634 domain-containing protein [Gemella palaticanis]MBF0715293.1 DUF1634 domain-containing protein [Gemella palaticanis]NYS47223.1 DUF1634 domain-containing protein [Gemella palaticanis]